MNVINESKIVLNSFLKKFQSISRTVYQNLPFQYNDNPLSEKIYYANRYWFQLLDKYYFDFYHFGKINELKKIASKEKVILISNHANTLEAYSLCYAFYKFGLGILRPLIFKGMFRLPFFRDLARAGRALPVDVKSGVDGLQEDHLLIFPEGMDFINKYTSQNKIGPFKKGYLRIAQASFKQLGVDHVYIVPVGHHGFDQLFRFWVLQDNMFIKKVVKPYLSFPYFIIPKSPIIMPGKAVFYWGKPIKVTPSQVASEQKIIQLNNKCHQVIDELSHDAIEKYSVLNKK